MDNGALVTISDTITDEGYHDFKYDQQKPAWHLLDRGFCKAVVENQIGTALHPSWEGLGSYILCEGDLIKAAVILCRIRGWSELVLLQNIAQVLSHGEQKYAPESWKLVPNGKNRYFSALMRHVVQCETGVLDESNFDPAALVACNIMFCWYFEQQEKV